MIPKSGNRFPAYAKPASAGEGRSEKIMRKHNMRRMQRIVMLAIMIAALPVLSGCADFDPDKLDVFGLNEKKKLPGDRKPVFPQGVPGVSQGIPAEYMKGNQPPPDTAQTLPPEADKAAADAAAKKAAAAEPVEQPKPKPKRKKPKATAAAPAPQPAQSQQQPPQQAPQQSSSAPWPSSPPTGTFSR
jgi:outer membrane biosynthesis protein TonB